jgi:hypothetical protein
MPDQSRPLDWKRLLAALVIFPLVGPVVLGDTVVFVTAVGNLFIQPYVPGEVSLDGGFNMVWLSYIVFPPALFLAAALFALAVRVFARSSLVTALFATAVAFAAWFAYVGLPTTDLAPSILLLIASFSAGVVLATAVCWWLWRALPPIATTGAIALTAIVLIGGIVAALFF